MGISGEIRAESEARDLSLLCRSPVVARVAGSRALLMALVLVGMVLVLVSAVRFQAPHMLNQHKVLTDFDAFHIAGSMAIDGHAGDAYHMRSLLLAQHTRTGTQGFMPWTYPPPFTLLMQGLAQLPIGSSFALFTLSSFTFYLWVLWRIAGRWMPGVAIAVMPAVLLNLRTGQNGFLIGGVIGCFLLALRGERGLAGLPLGLMVIKPHLAAGVGLVTLLERRWSVLAAAAMVALVLLGAATWAYGPGIWMDFRNAIGEAGEFLAKGYYPLFRMSSIYATGYTLGMGPTGAMALQLIGALAALVLLGRACLAHIGERQLAALVCATSLFVSPYGYDYDLTILSIALAFVMPELLERCGGARIMLLLALSWFVCGFGLAWTMVMSIVVKKEFVDLDANNGGVALIAPALVALCWWVGTIVRQPAKAQGTLGGLATGLG